MSELRPLSANTPVTLGLVLVVLAAVFSAGVFYQRLNANEEADRKRDTVIEHLTRLGADNKARLDLLEARVEQELRNRNRQP